MLSESNSRIFRISPLIRLTLQLLYVSLTLPLPFLAETVQAPIPSTGLWIAIGLGAVVLYGALSERVIVDGEQIQVTYPGWVAGWLRRGWSLDWGEIEDLKLRTTGQGGLVYYFVTRDRDRAYLLPMRVVGFAQLVKMVEAQTGIDTREVRPLAQPWMYLILLIFTGLLLLVDGWIVSTALQLHAQ